MGEFMVKTKTLTILSIISTFFVCSSWAMDNDPIPKWKTITQKSSYHLNHTMASEVVNDLNLGRKVSFYVDGDFYIPQGVKINGNCTSGQFEIYCTGKVIAHELTISAGSITVMTEQNKEFVNNFIELEQRKRINKSQEQNLLLNTLFPNGIQGNHSPIIIMNAFNNNEDNHNVHIDNSDNRITKDKRRTDVNVS
jgi:hypothetical protein